MFVKVRISNLGFLLLLLLHCHSQAVRTHLDLGAVHSIGVHWGTFQLTSEPLMQPVERLGEAIGVHGLEEDAFVVLEHGETRTWALGGAAAEGQEGGGGGRDGEHKA